MPIAAIGPRINLRLMLGLNMAQQEAKGKQGKDHKRFHNSPPN